MDIEKLNKIFKEFMEVDSSDKKQCDIVCKKMEEINKFFINGMISVNKEKTLGNIIFKQSTPLFHKDKPINEIIQYAEQNNIISKIAWCVTGKYINL